MRRSFVQGISIAAISAAMGFAQGAAPKAAVPPQVKALFDQARAAAAELPANAEPVFLSLIAQNEFRVAPEDAGRDAAAAFRQALALSSSGHADRDATVRSALLTLTLAKQGDLALQLVREAQPGSGLTKADLYNGLPLLEKAQKAKPDAVIALVHECEQADGTFPFALATQALQGKNPAEGESDGLVAEGYAAAGRVTTLTGAQSAVFFLSLGHRVDPARDGGLEDALTGLLQRLHSMDGDAATRTHIGHGLLDLLGKIDRDRANELKLTLPDFAAPPPSPPSIGGISIGVDAQGQAHFHFPAYMKVLMSAPELAETDPEAPVTRAAALSDPMDRFRALEGIATMLAKTKHPKQAQEAADAALAMIGNPIQLGSDTPPSAAGDGSGAGIPVNALVNSALVPATELAGMLGILGEAEAAHALLGKCLDAADGEAANLDREYGMDALRQPGKAEELPRRMFVLDAVYTEAAKVDFDIAAARARELRSPAVRALVLASLAGGWTAPKEDNGEKP